jgi:hypothetical protein
MTSQDDLRIGDWERNEAMSALREHFAQGRITHEELDERLDAALTARTAGDLRRVTADLPAPHGTRRPAAEPAPHRPPVHALQDEPEFGPAFGPGFGPRFGPLAGPFSRGHHPHMGHYRYRRPGRRGGRPRVLFLIFAVLIVASLVTGTAAPLVFMFKMLLFVWIAFAVIGLIHHRRQRMRP